MMVYDALWSLTTKDKHDSPRIFQCVQCGTSFNRQDSLRRFDASIFTKWLCTDLCFSHEKNQHAQNKSVSKFGSKAPEEVTC